MNIIKEGANYIKIDSTFTEDIIVNPNNYTSLTLTVNVDCAKNADLTDTVITETITLNNNKWLLDLDVPVKTMSFISNLYLQNLVTGKKHTVAINYDLAYILTNCANTSCALSDINDFKDVVTTAINSWFTTLGIVSSVLVEVTGNLVSISSLPVGFIVSSVIHGISNTEIKAKFNNLNSKIFISGSSIYLTPLFFNYPNDLILDGVYKVGLKVVKASNSGFITESNCAFIDILTSCLVANKLNIIKEIEPIDTTIHILHYALTNGSNCGCNCEELCEIYKELSLLLGTKTSTDCGC